VLQNASSGGVWRVAERRYYIGIVKQVEVPILAVQHGYMHHRGVVFSAYVLVTKHARP